jgi:hypothetical protein
MALDPVQDWAKGKDEYFALTGEKKPRESMFKFFTTTHTGLTKSIEKMTTDWTTRAVKEKTAKNFASLKKDYESAASKYCTLLEDLIKKEAVKTVVAQKVQNNQVVTEKWKTDNYRGLKMLKAKLDNYKASFERRYQDLLMMERNAGALEDENTSETQKSLLRLTEMEKTFLVGLKSGYTRLVSAAQAIKATPTVEVWNREFGTNEAARSLTTALGLYSNIDKTSARLNLPLTPKQTQMVQVTAQYKTQLDAWANGSKRSLPNGTSADQVLAELKTVTAIGKQCAAHFGI